MALTPEQLNTIEFGIAQQATHNKMEAIRIARDVLIENSRSKPVDARDITAADVTSFAESLIQYVNQ